VKRWLVAAAALAFGMTIAYAAVLQPDWESYRDDQRQYLALARGLATRGEFTRATPGEEFIPEPLRTPGYPLLLAPVCVLGGCEKWQVAIAQAVLNAVLPLLVFALVAPLGRRLALASAFAVGAYPFFAYYAALPLSDLPAAVLLVAACAAAARARDRTRWAVLAGLATGVLALTRPIFVLFPLAVGVALALAAGAPPRRRALAVLLLLAAHVTVILPFNLYSYRYFGGPFASSSGSGLWWGYFQGKGGPPAAVAAFRSAALAGAPDAELVEQGRAAALDPLESVEAGGALRDIDRFDRITDRHAQTYGWIELNASLARRATTLIVHDPVGHLARGLTVRTIELWAGELPIRVRDFQRLPPLVALASALVQTWLFLAGLLGLALLARRRSTEALLLGGAVLYVWLVSIPFVTEPRYSLAARPALLVGVVAAVAELNRRRRSSVRSRGSSR